MGKRKKFPWIWLLAIPALVVLCLVILILWLRPRGDGGVPVLDELRNPVLMEPSSATVEVEQTRVDCVLLTYIVQAGDTLGAIAASFDIPLEMIRERNMLESDELSPGMILDLPMCDQ
jgi:hypothetical protein